MAEIDARLVRLAQMYGISTEFWDWKGNRHATPEQTIIACLAAFDVDIVGDDWMDRAIVAMEERPWKSALPTCTVSEEDCETSIAVRTRQGQLAHVWVRLEDGTTFPLDARPHTRSERLVDGEAIECVQYTVPQGISPGYHTVFLDAGNDTTSATLIVTPARQRLPHEAGGSIWGFMAQFYSLDSRASWGVGDFVDLKDVAIWAKTQHDAQYILINPTHAAEVIPPMEPSPYLPSTRRYTNPIYIRPEMVEEYATVAEDVRAKITAIHRSCREHALGVRALDRNMVWAAKKVALRMIFDEGRRPARQAQMQAFLDREGRHLFRYATWCALTETYGQKWSEWPLAYQDPESREVEVFTGGHHDEIMFYMWLQWVADEQARAAQHAAKDVGMALGVMADLAVGVSKDGQEAWSGRDVFATGVSAGVPPDAYTQAGQDWQQPPWRPDRLEETSYAPFRDMIRAVLSRSGGVRIDHIIGLFRMWWTPDGCSPSQGAYVRYNHEAMVGIAVLEAVRAGALVVGEDLGTVEPWAREYLARRGILGTSILWFENGQDGKPLHPEQWRRLCMGSVTTHDLPPTLGYLAHDHVQLRYQLGLLTESLEEEINHDALEQGAMMSVLTERGLLRQGESDPHEVVLALHRFLYQTQCMYKTVALTDAVGERRTQNQPGTIDEYPNWRVPLGDETGHRLTLEEIFTMDGVGRITDIMNGKV